MASPGLPGIVSSQIFYLTNTLSPHPPLYKYPLYTTDWDKNSSISRSNFTETFNIWITYP
jgi:hypothetical protein